MSNLTLTEILSEKYDITDCITNCYGNGVCSLNENQKFFCECDENYIGAKCQTSSKSCASSLCINGATCMNELTKIIQMSV